MEAILHFREHERLTGGIGLSDLFYMHFERFSEDFSVIIFDYQLAFESNKEFADAVAELLNRLEVKVWLMTVFMKAWSRYKKTNLI